MTQISFDADALGRTAGDMQRTDVASQLGTNARPCVVTLESGIQAIIEVAGFPYIKPLPIAGASLAGEDVDAGAAVIGNPDRI